MRGARGRIRGALKVALALFAGFAITLLAYRAIAHYGVAREVRNASRDAAGYIVGAGPRDLGPEDAPCAALFVHGFVGGGDNFGEAPERLAARGWRVRVMRLPGHGTDPRDFEKCDVDTLLAAVIAEADALRARHDKVMLVGHSMGGALSVLAAAQGKADALILGAPYFGVTYHWYYGLRPETWARVTAPWLRWTYKGQAFVQVNRPEAKGKIMSYHWIPLRAAVTLAEIGERAAAPEIVSKIDCPVLAFQSHHDAAASAEAVARAINAMPSREKRLVWVDRSNHHVFVDYDCDEVLGKMEAFSDEIAQKAD